MGKRPVPCLGILGWMFGHKFMSMSLTYVQDYCLRCGVPIGVVKEDSDEE